MMEEQLRAIGGYVMPEAPVVKSDLALIFGTRHGVEKFCSGIAGLWEAQMFSRAIVSGGQTAGLESIEAHVIADRLIELGIPSGHLLIEPKATHTGENVRFARALAEASLSWDQRRSVILVGKVCSARRYLMTMRRHWPDPSLSALWINYFAVEQHRWHEDPDFRARVLGEYRKIPDYVRSDFLRELELGSYPAFDP